MNISSSLLPEFDQLIAGTRKTLERIPADKLDYRPHEKSFPIISLATHVVNMIGWGITIINHDDFDFQPPGSAEYREEPAKSVPNLLTKFDQNVAELRAALAGANDERLLANWSLLKTGAVMFTLPRLTVLRDFVFNHTIHHRAQLGVYLRLLDVPVPSIYGPSADENPF